jgi:hypothetical protein
MAETSGFADPVMSRLVSSDPRPLVRGRAVCRAWRESAVDWLARAVLRVGPALVLGRVMGAPPEAADWFMREGAREWTQQPPCRARDVILMLAVGQPADDLAFEEKANATERMRQRFAAPGVWPGRLDVAQWAVRRFGIGRREALTCMCAPLRATRDPEIARWLVAEFQLTPDNIRASRVLRGAMARGDLALATALVSSGETIYNLCNCRRGYTICPCHMRDRLDWTRATFGVPGPDPVASVAAAFCAHDYPLVHWLCDHAVNPYDFVATADLELKAWLASERGIVVQRPRDVDDQVVRAIEAHDLVRLRRLVDAYKLQRADMRATKAMERAFALDQLDTVEWLRQRFAMHGTYMMLAAEACSL